MRFFLSISVVLSLLYPTFAQGPTPEQPDEPEAAEVGGKIRLTLDPGHHVGYMSSMVFTPDGAELLTTGRDHTVRVWDPRTGELLRVLRPPGLGEEMRVALSPDGKTLAVGAHHVGDKGMQHAVYLISVADGRVERTLPAFKDGYVFAVAFSADGKRLVATSTSPNVGVWDLNKSAEPRVIPAGVPLLHMALSPDGAKLVEMRKDDFTGHIRDLASGKLTPLAAGKLYHYRIRPLAWSPDSATVATATPDGLKLWSTDGKLRTHVLQKQKTASVAFSRDSKRLLVTIGYNQTRTATAMIINAATGEKELDLVPKGSPHAPHMGVFSPDGTLVATEGGDAAGDIIVWDAVTGAIVQQLTAPEWLHLGMSAGWSADGLSVAWGTPKKDAKGKSSGRATSFDLGKLKFGASLNAAQLHGSLVKGGPYELKLAADLAPKIFKTVEVKKGKEKVKTTEEIVIKVPRKLGPNRGDPHTLVGKDRVALSAGFTVYLYDLKTKKQIRSYRSSGWVRSVALSPNHKFMMILAEDQILHIVDPERAGEVLSLYVNERDWIAWTPEGYYAASPNGERLIGWTVDHGLGKDASYHPASRFRASLYRPDVIKRILNEGNLTKALAAADKVRAKQTKQVELAQVLPPEVRVTVTPPVGQAKVNAKGFVTLTIDADAQPQGTQPITALQLLVDDRPYTDKDGPDSLVAFASPKSGTVKASWQVNLPAGPHDIRVLARTEVSLGTSRGIKRVDAPAAAAKKVPNLYVLAIGIDAYPGTLKLNGAVNDTKNLTKAFRENSSKLFGNIDAAQSSTDSWLKVITDKDATKAGILKGLDWLKTKATAGDVTVFFFAGHGERDKEEFYLVPQDVDIKDLAKTGVSRQEIKKRVQALPGRVLVLLDACHSGALGLLFDDLSRELADEDCGVAVMCAARPSQFALEAKGQGFFTQSLVGGLAGKAPQRNGSVFLHHLQSHVIDQVSELSQDRQHPVVVVPPWMPPFAVSRPTKNP